MKQILVLTRMQLGSALDFLNMGNKKNRKKNVSTAMILFLGALLFAFISGFYCFGMGGAMKQVGQLDVLPGFFMAATCIVILITSVYKAKGVLFGFKDYDMLMSLPVKASKIVASRLLQLYIINMVFAVGMMVPCYVVYGILANPNPLFYVYAIIALLFIPLIPIIIASIIGVVLGYISSRFKFSNIANTVIVLFVFIAFFFVTLNVQDETQLIQIGTMFRDKMNSTYPLAHWFNEAVINFDFMYFLAFILCSLIAFLVFSVVLGSCFKKLNTKISAVYSGKKYKHKELKQNSALGALYKKEAKRYFTCSIYVFNTAFSILLMLIAAVGIHVAKIDQIDLMINTPQIAEQVRGLLPYIIGIMVWMCAISASSISLEGKNLWIIKSAPINVKTIFQSKILLHISLIIPTAIITAISMMIKFKSTGFEIVLTLLLSIAYCYFSAVFGLFVNLKFPLMDWKNETVVVKQSAASLIATMSGVLFVGLPVVLTFVIPGVDINIISIITLAILILGSVLLEGYMNKNGERIIAKL